MTRSQTHHVNQTSQLGQHAIVIGGSMAGLLTARILSSHFARVTILERDMVVDAPESRKGQPQTRHLHALLAKGLDVMTHYFPDLPQGLEENGALLLDMGQTMRWYAFGGYRVQFDSGMVGALMSRPLLEWQVRRRVLALPNVTLLDEVDVKRVVFTQDCARVTGVDVVRRGMEKQRASFVANLVVDASGRGTASPKWLDAAGYGKPAESVVKVNMGYATRVFKRTGDDLGGARLIIVSGEAPDDRRAGLIFPIEGDRWICTLAGMAGDYRPTDEQGFMDYARSLAAPDVYNALIRLEPLSDIVGHKLPSSLRRHYEKMARFPEGYLVLGDAICSFNPVYGQGMTSATLQAEALDRVLIKRHGKGLAGVAREFFAQAAKIVEIPWQMAVGEDFRYAETEGKKAPGTDFINAYGTLVHRTTHHDAVVLGEFMKVMNLMQPPASLFHPQVVWRVLRSQVTLRPGAMTVLQPVSGD